MLSSWRVSWTRVIPGFSLESLFTSTYRSRIDSPEYGSRKIRTSQCPHLPSDDATRRKVDKTSSPRVSGEERLAEDHTAAVHDTSETPSWNTPVVWAVGSLGQARQT